MEIQNIEERGNMERDIIPCNDCCVVPTNPWSVVTRWFNIGIGIILIVGLILGPYLIYRKHKGEKGLWKKILKWDLLYFLIVAVLWFIVSFIVWRIKAKY